MLKNRCRILKLTCLLGLTILLSGILLSCAHSPPPPSIGDFTDQVLEPLAARLADEKVSQARADIITRFTPKASERGFQDLLTNLPYIGKLLEYGENSRKAELEEYLAWLETRCNPLKQELIELFIKRTVRTETGFAVCAEGKQRQYQAIEGGRFTRLPDGSAQCEKTELRSLKKESP